MSEIDKVVPFTKPDCPCGAELPWHLLRVLPSLTHTCSCYRVFDGVSKTQFELMGTGPNPSVEVDRKLGLG